MSPVTWASPPTVNRFPRVSGDEPYDNGTVIVPGEFSPRERG